MDASHLEGMQVQECVEPQEEERPPDAVDLMQVGHAVGPDGAELAVDVAGGLFLLHPEEPDVGQPFEEGLQHGRGGDGELHVGVGGRNGLDDGRHEGDIAESREPYDENVLHFCRRR